MTRLQELAGPRLVGVAEELLRAGRARGSGPAWRKHTSVGDLAGEAHLVGGDSIVMPLALEVADDVEHLADQLGVERAT